MIFLIFLSYYDGQMNDARLGVSVALTAAAKVPHCTTEENA
jgi:hypothetical protein